MLSIQLRAYNPEQNINQTYSLLVHKNLFGAWTITIQYAAFRTRGRSKLFFCDSLEEAKNRVHLILKRRLKFNKRLGAAYKIMDVNADSAINIDEWIPPSDSVSAQ